MKSLVAATLVVLSVASPLHAAQSAGPKASPEEVMRALVGIELEVVRGNETCDRETFERIEADEFIFTSPGGKVSDKKQDLDSLKNCRHTAMHASIDDPRLQLHGDVALLNAQITEHPTDRTGTVVTRRYRFSDVFVWRDGRWQMVLGHSSQIPEPK